MGGGYFVVGGVDQILVIQQGTVDEVRRATARTVEIGKPGGHFILQNADFLEYGTPPEKRGGVRPDGDRARRVLTW